MDAYDVIIIGGGVTGTATLYLLSQYTNVKRIALIEKYGKLAQVNTRKDNNSQTLHFGDIETNYTAEKSAKVNASSSMTARYLDAHVSEHLFVKSHKMVLAVGKKEIDELSQRFDAIKHIYPRLRRIKAKEIGKIEPKVMEGRTDEVLALFSPDGYVVDYGKLSASFVRHAKEIKSKKIDIMLNHKIMSVTRDGDMYVVTGTKELRAKVVVVATGADSLLFAHRLGYARHWILLPVAGSFYRSKHLLNGKVYTMQAKKLPFAAVHGDPDVGNMQETRFGPTAKVLPMTERYHYSSIMDFLRLFRFRIDAILSLLRIISDPVLCRYILKNVVYDIPLLGTYMFMKQNVRKIVPSIKYGEISYGRRLGGIRPQLVDTKKKSLEFGDAKVIGDNIIFDITPSPGASVCIKNGEQNMREAVKFLGSGFSIDEERFAKDLL